MSEEYIYKLPINKEYHFGTLINEIKAYDNTVSISGGKDFIELESKIPIKKKDLDALSNIIAVHDPTEIFQKARDNKTRLDELLSKTRSELTLEERVERLERLKKLE